jgi:hypothetical protein
MLVEPAWGMMETAGVSPPSPSTLLLLLVLLRQQLGNLPL